MSARALPLVAWRRIVARRDAEFDAAQIDAVEAECAEVPDAVRLAPGRWMRALFERGVEPRLRICRAIDLTLYDVEISGDRFAWTDAPELAQVTVLRVFDERLDDRGLERWLRCANNSRVTELALAGGIMDRGALRLAHDDRLASLRSLALFRSKVGPEGIAALIASPQLGANLRRLLLGRNQLGEPEPPPSRATRTSPISSCSISTAITSTAPRSKRSFTRRCSQASARSTSATTQSAPKAALAACPHLGALEQLFLHGCQLDDESVAILLRAPFIARLRNLALSENHLSLTTIERIAAAHELSLRELDICHNHFAESRSRATLQTSPMFAGLQRLCL